MHEVLNPRDVLSRYLVDSSHAGKEHVKPKAFEPPFDIERNRHELSVYVTSELDEDRIWKIAALHVEPSRGKAVFARAEIVAEAVRRAGLAVVDDSPPDRHAVIVGWPEGTDEKPARTSLQQQLAKSASLHRRAASQ